MPYRIRYSKVQWRNLNAIGQGETKSSGQRTTISFGWAGREITFLRTLKDRRLQRVYTTTNATQKWIKHGRFRGLIQNKKKKGHRMPKNTRTRTHVELDLLLKRIITRSVLSHLALSLSLSLPRKSWPKACLVKRSESISSPTTFFFDCPPNFYFPHTLHHIDARPPPFRSMNSNFLPCFFKI